MKTKTIENILIKNRFKPIKYPCLNEYSNSYYTISWGHSEIKSFRKGKKQINIQFQNSEFWSVIFDSLPFEYSYISAKQSLNNYKNIKSISDFKNVCLFVKNIKLK